jgi:hypothetical protein
VLAAVAIERQCEVEIQRSPREGLFMSSVRFK